MQKRHPGEGGAVLLGGERADPTKTTPIFQPATVAEICAMPPDEIITFLGNVPPEEYELRSKLRSYRNAASAMVGATPSPTARQLAWTVIEWASPNLYSPAPLSWLTELNLLCQRLMVTAMQVEKMHLLLEEPGHE